MTPDKEIELNRLRGQIDAIDAQILHLLEKRFDVVENVGELKDLKNSKETIIRPTREALMVRNLIKESSGKIADNKIISIMRKIIGSSVALEENTEISTCCDTGYWLSREYFGEFNNITIRNNAKDAVEKLLTGEASLAVIPFKEDKIYWDMLKGEGAPKIFAKVPVIESNAQDFVAIANLEIENTSEQSFINFQDGKFNTSTTIDNKDDIIGFFVNI